MCVIAECKLQVTILSLLIFKLIIMVLKIANIYFCRVDRQKDGRVLPGDNCVPQPLPPEADPSG